MLGRSPSNIVLFALGLLTLKDIVSQINCQNSAYSYLCINRQYEVGLPSKATPQGLWRATRCQQKFADNPRPETRQGPQMSEVPMPSEESRNKIA